MASLDAVWERRRMQRLGGTLVVLVGLALAGCSSPSVANTTSASPTAFPAVTTAAPSATPSASPSLSPLPSTSAPSRTTPPATTQGDPCADPSVSFDGLTGIDFDRYAKICVGMSFAEASNAMPGPPINGEASCPWYAFVLSVNDPGLYVAAVTRPDKPGASIYMFLMSWQGDPAAAKAFDSPSTIKGISVGSTTAEVKAAYSTATSITFNDTARGPRTQLIVAGPRGTSMVFDVTSGAVSDMYWGKGIPQGVNGELCSL
jgi:hypothetical protein